MKHIKAFALFLMAMACLLISCGSDNQVSMGSNGNPNIIPTTTNPIFESLGSEFQRFASNVKNKNFAPVAYNYASFNFVVFRPTTPRTTQECDRKLGGFLTICRGSSSGSYFTVTGNFQRTMDSGINLYNHEHGNSDDAVLSSLVRLIEQTKEYESGMALNGSTVHYIRLANGEVYGFNLSAPILANPVYKYAPNGEGYSN